MTPADLHYLFNYSYWARDRLVAAAERASDERLHEDVGLPNGGVLGTLLHTVEAEFVWRSRCAEGAWPSTLLDPVDFATLDAVVARMHEEEQRTRAYLSSLTDADCASTLSYRSTGGKVYTHVLWQILAHIVNHGTQHRSECAHVLTSFGHSPGDIDLVTYERTQQEREP